MTPHARPAAFDPFRWREDQLRRHGPIVGGAELRKSLGFRTPAGFQKARTQGTVGVRTFSMPGRQGVYAMTAEVCDWIITQRCTGDPIGAHPGDREHDQETGDADA